MIIYEEIKNLQKEGYREDYAKSKLGQDIVLKAIAVSGMAQNATIKGGVVMQNISKDARRATHDLDLDFIRYSLSDDSIFRFVKKLNCIEGLNIQLIGNILPLNHQDYAGKRINISISDTEGTIISLKIDLGVHKDLSIAQEEYAFDLSFQEDTVSLLINSYAQIVTEKLKSLIRFGTRNTRYKDIFDICYLSDYVKISQLKMCIKNYIIDDDSLRNINSMDDIIYRIERMISNSEYISQLKKSNKNWLDISIEESLKKTLRFLKSINSE